MRRDAMPMLGVENVIEPGLDAGAFTDDRLDRHQCGDIAIALERLAIAAAIEPPVDAGHPALDGPCGGGGIHALALAGGEQDHMRDTRLDLVEPAPDDPVIMPFRRPRNDNDRPLR
ncbi:conserved hypothetical protein, partial [Ricinus communis]